MKGFMFWLALGLAIGFIAATLTGCVSSAERLARDQQECAAYGHQMGSQGMASCVEHRHDVRRAEFMDAMDSLQATSNQMILNSQLQMLNANLMAPHPGW